MRAEIGMEQAAEAGGYRIKRRALLYTASAAVVLSAVAVGWACRASSGGGVEKAQAGAAAASPEAGSPRGASAQAKATPTQAAPVVTALTPAGFTPDRVTHASGRFNLKVKNQSGQKEVVLRLSNAAGEKLWEVRLTDKVRDWTGPVELAAGSYTLSEASRPDWTCRLEVTPQ